MHSIAFLASGGGSNFQAILNRIQSGALQDAKAALLITNNSKCGAVEKARAANIPVVHLSGQTHPDPQQFAQAMVAALRQYAIDWIVLAGYMKRVPDQVLEAWPNRVINIHPALLPAFGGPGHWGHHVHEAVIQAGVRVSGATVHFVDSVYDHGQIIAQRPVRVYSDDTPDDVAARVLMQEHDLYWRVLDALIHDRVGIRHGKVWGEADR